MLLAHVGSWHGETYFMDGECYHRNMWTFPPRWYVSDGLGPHDWAGKQICDTKMINQLEQGRVRSLEKFMLLSTKVDELAKYLPRQSLDCVNIIHWYLCACTPWPIRPVPNPMAMTCSRRLNVQNMVPTAKHYGRDTYSGIMIDNVPHIAFRKIPRSLWQMHTWIFRKDTVHIDRHIEKHPTAMEYIILERKHEQLSA